MVTSAFLVVVVVGSVTGSVRAAPVSSSVSVVSVVSVGVGCSVASVTGFEEELSTELSEVVSVLGSVVSEGRLRSVV